MPTKGPEFQMFSIIRLLATINYHTFDLLIEQKRPRYQEDIKNSEIDKKVDKALAKNHIQNHYIIDQHKPYLISGVPGW